MSKDWQSAVIDRIVDGSTAVLLVGEEEAQFLCPVSALPAGSKEGSWLLVIIKEGELVEASLDQAKTESVLQEVQEKRAQLLKRSRRR